MEKTLDFEASFQRLEAILEKINSSQISLEDSLKLYEEADALLVSCQSKLADAEKRVEILIKNRSNEIVLDKNMKPQTEPFSPSKS